jgi:hypothetical protein
LIIVPTDMSARMPKRARVRARPADEDGGVVALAMAFPLVVLSELMFSGVIRRDQAAWERDERRAAGRTLGCLLN